MTSEKLEKQSKRIGLIGGLAFRAGVFYYDQILQTHDSLGKTLDLLLRHADVKTVLPLVASNNRRELGKYLGVIANELADAGASFVAVTAVAPHIAIEEMSAISRIPVVNVLDQIASAIKAQGFDRIAVFGNRAVIQSNIFGALSDEMVVKLEPSMLDEVHAMYTDIALNGKRGTPDETKRLDELASHLIETRGAEAVVLAGTDLSSFYAEQKPDYPFLDVAKLHVDQIMSLCRP